MKTLHDDRLDEKQLSTRTAFEGRLLHLFVDKVGLPNGNESTGNTSSIREPWGSCPCWKTAAWCL